MNISFNFNKYKFPKDWTKIKLKDCLLLTERPIKMEDDIEYRLVTVKRNFGGIQERSIQKGKEILVKSQFTINEGDFIISKRQIAHGACGIVPKELDNSIVSNEYNVLKARENLNLDFFNYYVQLPFVKRYFYISSDGVHIEKLLFKTNDWLNRFIVIPPIEEQEKIAKILSTWDLAIDKQQQLIEKKKEFKKGLMQRLLSGEVRFKEFTDEWKIIELKDIGEINTGSTPSTKEEKYYKNGVFLWVTPTDISDDKYVTSTAKKLSYEGIKQTRIIKKNSLLITCIASIGKNAIIKEESACNQQINAITPDEGFYVDFLYYLISYNEKYLKLFAGKSATQIINKSTLGGLKFKFPSYKEQVKIAEVLSTADKEIELLEKELEALKLQKKGLMQRLLTGEVRVKV